jgi:tRNA(Ile2) C34 agmatinyltransferase TiaS
MEKPCDCCQRVIPKFENLSQKDETHIRRLIREGKPVTAINELRTITHSSLMEAKLWVEHCGEFTRRATAPCPYCGEPLRTSLAKQCRFCLRDWHNENS